MFPFCWGLVKAHFDRNIVHTDRPSRRPAKLMTLPALAFLGCDGRRALIHILLNIVVVFVKIIEHSVLNRPLKEVELTNSRVHTHKLNALPTAEGVEHLLAVGLEVCLVSQVHDHVAPRVYNVRDVMLLGIVGNEPVNQTQTELGLARDDVPNTGKVSVVSIER